MLKTTSLIIMLTATTGGCAEDSRTPPPAEPTRLEDASTGVRGAFRAAAFAGADLHVLRVAAIDAIPYSVTNQHGAACAFPDAADDITMERLAGSPDEATVRLIAPRGTSCVDCEGGSRTCFDFVYELPAVAVGEIHLVASIANGGAMAGSRSAMASLRLTGSDEDHADEIIRDAHAFLAR